MQLSHILSLFSIVATAAADSVSYDTGYDDATRSLSVVACSDGVNGLMTKYNWKTQGDVKGFPYIGGVPAVTSWNSPSVIQATSRCAGRSLKDSANHTGV